MLLPNERVEIVRFCRRMQADDLTVGSSGNLSVRSGNRIAITPSGVAFEDLTATSICVVDLNGNPVDHHGDPSGQQVGHGGGSPAIRYVKHVDTGFLVE